MSVGGVTLPIRGGILGKGGKLQAIPADGHFGINVWKQEAPCLTDHPCPCKLIDLHRSQEADLLAKVDWTRLPAFLSNYSDHLLKRMFAISSPALNLLPYCPSKI